MDKILNFDSFSNRNFHSIDINSFGELNESNQYFPSVCSVMDKITRYSRNSAFIEMSSLNESVKVKLNRDIMFNNDEMIGASLIVSDLFNRYQKKIMEDISYCDMIINGDIESLNESRVGDLLNKKKEQFSTWVKDTVGDVKDTAKEIITKSIEIKDNTVDYVVKKKDEFKDWATELKKELETKLKRVGEFIEKILKVGIKSVKEFIDFIGEYFSNLGETLKEALKALGVLKKEEGEKTIKIDVDDSVDMEKVYNGVDGEDEKSFFNHIISRVNVMMTKDKKNAEKLISEGMSQEEIDNILEESLVDNKFIGWLSGYKENGEKLSIGKSIIISFCASLIVNWLPKIFIAVGIINAANPLVIFTLALVAFIWSGVGMLKLIYKRNKNRKPGEKFFDKKTAIFFTLSCVSLILAGKAVGDTFKPAVVELAKICKVDENSKGLGGWLAKLGEKYSPGSIIKKSETVETIQEDMFKSFGNGTSNSRASWGESIKDNADELHKNLIDSGVSKEQADALKNFMVTDETNPMKIHAHYKSFANSDAIPQTWVIDSSIPGVPGSEVKQFIDEIFKNPIMDGAINTTAGSMSAVSGDWSGYNAIITNVSDEQRDFIINSFRERFGDGAAKQIAEYFVGNGPLLKVVKKVTTIKERVAPILNARLPWLAVIFPFFDKKKHGDYMMRFGSGTRGLPSYIVENVEMKSTEEVKSINQDNTAVDKLISIHNDAYEESKKLAEEAKKKDVNEAFGFKNKNKNSEETNGENKKSDDSDITKTEPKFIVFYINKNKVDRAKELSSDKEKEKKKKKDDKNEKKDDIIPAIILDTLTLMCADICPKEFKPRKNPYFLKGLLSKLSFRPVKDVDNDTKKFIHSTLATSMKTAIEQCANYGLGQKYITRKDEGKGKDMKVTYSVNDGVVADKASFELGNLTPKEMCDALNDNNKTNHKSYDLLDGRFGSEVSIKKDKEGKTVRKAKKSSSSIEFNRYYEVTEEDKKNIDKEYDDKLKKFNDGKRKSKPRRVKLITGRDGKTYRKATSKMLNDKKSNKTFVDFVDIFIVPMLDGRDEKSEIYDELHDDQWVKKLLYKDDKLNMDAIEIIRPFLYRAEKTFSETDDYELEELLRKGKIEGKKISKFMNLFKDEEQVHDTLKRVIEIVWDELSGDRELMKKARGQKEGFESYTLFDQLLEESYFYDEEEEYDDEIINENNTSFRFMSFNEFVNNRF